MSSHDPLSDPLADNSSSVISQPAPSVPISKKGSDLFAAPFESSTWTHHQLDSTSPEEPTTRNPLESNETREEPVEPSRLNVHAPSFVPSFAASPSPSEPIPIPLPSPATSRNSQDEQEGEMGSIGEATPQAKRPSPLSLANNAPLLSHSPSQPTRSLPPTSLDRAQVNSDDSDTAQEEEVISNSQSSPLSPSTSKTHPPPPLHSPPRSPSTPSSSTYSPSILRNLIAQSCQSGDLPRLKLLFSQSSPQDAFSLSNSLNPTTGYAPIHYASKKGHSEVVKWLVEEASALVGLEDSDGETALHKACLSGRTDVAEYLVGLEGVQVECRDNDGWTPLHNAASIGSLPLISLLLSRGASISPLSSHGYTPLMSSASKGHLPSIHFLLKKGADPLVRNKSGETAYDLAAGVFELEICQVLNEYEKTSWRGKIDEAKKEGKELRDYNLLGLHSTVPVVVYENQRLVSSSSLGTFKTFSKLFEQREDQQRWSSKALSRNDKRAAFSLPREVLEGLTGVEGGEEEERACFRSEVGLPVVGKENSLVVPDKREIRSGGRVKVQELVNRSQTLKKKQKQKPSLASNSLNSILASTSTDPIPEPPRASTSSSSSASQGTPAWVWLSNWTIDLSSPLSSPTDGWSYSQSFSTSSSEWEPSLPVEGTGNAKKWVRRRRWVRVMRRRVDLKDWGYLDTPLVEGEQQDYRVKAKVLIGELRREEEEELESPNVSRQSRARLERAAQELRSGIEVDEDEQRKREAQKDLEKILERIALLAVQGGGDGEGEGDDDSEDEFVYDGRDAGDEDDARSIWTTTQPSSVRTPSVFEDREPPSDFMSTTPTTAFMSHQQQDFTPQLAQNPEFRVPTDEHAPFYPASSNGSVRQVSHHRTTWEPDEVANDCRRCGAEFSFFKRKHHCRRCGLVCCANCTTHKDAIDPYLVVREPGIPPTLEDLQPWSLSSPLVYRTCDSCHAALSLPSGLSASVSSSILSPQSFFPPSPSVGGSATPSETNESEASELTECPCCGLSLGGFGERTEQETHVRNCLEQGEGSIASGRYLVFNLPSGPLVGEDCGICFSEFEVNDRMARLVCLCTFHETCIRAWLSRGHTCPVHVPRED